MFSRLILLFQYVKSRNASFIFTLLFLFSFIYIRLPHISSFVQNNTLSTSVRFISETSALLEKAAVHDVDIRKDNKDDDPMVAMISSLQECQQLWTTAFPYTPAYLAPKTLVRSYCFAQTFRTYRSSAIRFLSPLLARAILDTDSTPLFQHWDKTKLINLALFSSKNEVLWLTHNLKREMHQEWKTVTRLMEDLMDDCFFYTEQIILETHILIDLFWDLVSFCMLVLHFYSYFLYLDKRDHFEHPT